MGNEGREKADFRVEQFLGNFLSVQHRRAAVYNRLHRGFADYLKTGAEVAYQELCSQVTADFNECSRQVLDIEAALKDPSLDRLDLAAVLQSVQLHEKQKLQMTATLQVLRRAGRPSERSIGTQQEKEHSMSGHHHGGLPCSHNPSSDRITGLEMAKLEAEYDAAIKEATGEVQDAVLAINEHIEEVRYEIEELGQRRKQPS